MTATTPQISFALNNAAVGETIYISDNMSDNKLSLQIRLIQDSSNGVTALFEPGTFPTDAAPQGSGSLLYLDLSELGLSTAEFNALTLGDSDWSFTLYSDSESEHLIGFTPTRSMTLGGDDTFTLSLDNFTLSTKPAASTVQFNVTYFRIGNVTRNDIPMTGNFGVAIAYPRSCTVVLSWTADHATKLRLFSAAAPRESQAFTSVASGAQLNPINVTGLSSYTTQISDSTQFSLEAEGQSPDNQVDNGYIAYCTAYIEPVITEFTVSPQSIDDGPLHCKIEWAVNAPQGTDVRLSGSETGLSGMALGLSGSIFEDYAVPQWLTLTATPPAGHPQATAQSSVYVLPIITQLGAEVVQQQLDRGGKNTTYNIFWNIDGLPGTTATMTSVGRDEHGYQTKTVMNITVDLSGSFHYNVNHDYQTLTLKAFGPYDAPAVGKAIALG